MKKIYTLCLVQRGDEVLLGMKKRGFGAGKWDGFGGKVHDGESIEEATRRELTEEAGIVATDCTKRAVMQFTFEGDPVTLEIHLFFTAQFSGEPKASEEMEPRWFSIHEIPFDSMWPADRYWFPLFLAGKNFRGIFHYRDASMLLRHVVEEVSNI